MEQQREAFLASLPKPKPKPPVALESKSPEKKVAPPKLTKEEEIYRDKWDRFLDMIMKGRLDIAKTFWEREGEALGGIDAAIPEWTGERYGTLLQVAASARQAEVTAWLLDELNADPTIPVPSGAPQLNTEEPSADSLDNAGSRSASPLPNSTASGGGRTAYDVAATRTVRDVFRRSAGARPDAWDWLGAAHVPSALSAEQEAERDSKKKEKRRGMKERIREREAKERERAAARTPEPEPEPEPVRGANGRLGGPQKLGGGGATTGDGLVGLTPEMRAKVERERRARAAEARFKTLGKR